MTRGKSGHDFDRFAGRGRGDQDRPARPQDRPKIVPRGPGRESPPPPAR